MWADATQYHYPTWHRWGTVDPNSGEKCARLRADWDGGWYGRTCSIAFAYICEKGTQNVPFYNK